MPSQEWIDGYRAGLAAAKATADSVVPRVVCGKIVYVEGGMTLGAQLVRHAIDDHCERAQREDYFEQTVRQSSTEPG